MLRTTATIVLFPLMLAVSSAAIRCDDVPASKRSELTDELTVSEAVQLWSSAVSEIHRVDVEFIRYVYDMDFEVVRSGEGRLVVESGFQQFVSIRPFGGEISTSRLKSSGKPFDVRQACSERLVMNNAAIWIVDDDKKDAIQLLTGTKRDSKAAGSTRPFLAIVTTIVDSIPLFFSTVGQINGPIAGSGSSLPEVNQTLHQRFDITMTNTDAEHVYLSLLPRFAQDGNSFRRIDIVLSRETWLPDATKFFDPSGTKETVYVIRKRRINDCPERTRHLFDLDLLGYNVYPPEPARTSTAAAGR